MSYHAYRGNDYTATYRGPPGKGYLYDPYSSPQEDQCPGYARSVVDLSEERADAELASSADGQHVREIEDVSA